MTNMSARGGKRKTSNLRRRLASSFRVTRSECSILSDSFGSFASSMILTDGWGLGKELEQLLGENSAYLR